MAVARKFTNSVTRVSIGRLISGSLLSARPPVGPATIYLGGLAAISAPFYIKLWRPPCSAQK